MQLIDYNDAGQVSLFGLTDPDTGDYITDSDISSASLKALMTVGKNSGAAAAAAGTLTYLGGGFWEYAPSQTETQAAILRVSIIDTNSPKRWIDEAYIIYSSGATSGKIALDLHTLWTNLGIATVGTASSIAANGITASSIAANAIGNTEIADGALTSGKFATGAIQGPTINDGALTAAKFGTDAIGATQFAQAAADKVWQTATRALTAGVNVTQINGIAAAASLLAKMYSGAIVTGTIPSTWGGASSGVHGLSAPDVDAFKYSLMVFITGANAGHTGQSVSANNATTISVASAFKNTPQSGDEYIIIGRSLA